MRDREQLYLLHQLAKTYGQRPSVLLGIDPDEQPLLADNLDRAAWLWGTFVENKLQETTTTGTGKHERTKPKYTLAQLLGTAPGPGRRKQYKSPLNLMRAGPGR